MASDYVLPDTIVVGVALAEALVAFATPAVDTKYASVRRDRLLRDAWSDTIKGSSLFTPNISRSRQSFLLAYTLATVKMFTFSLPSVYV